MVYSSVKFHETDSTVYTSTRRCDYNNPVERHSENQKKDNSSFVLSFAVLEE